LSMTTPPNTDILKNILVLEDSDDSDDDSNLSDDFDEIKN